MLDRVAKAVDEARAKWRQEHNCFVHSDFDPPAELLALAAIMGMRDPTYAMLEAYHDASWSFPDTWKETVRLAWQTMTDAALTGT